MRLLLVALLLAATIRAEDRDDKVRNDRSEYRDGWIYNDLEAGIAAARKSDRPLLVVLRCIP